MDKGDRTPRARDIHRRAVRKSQRRARRLAIRSAGAAAAAASLTLAGLTGQPAEADHYPVPRPDHGIRILKDIVRGDRPSFPAEPTDVRGTLFFVAGDLRHGRELWKSDGTTSGTVMVRDVMPGKAESWPQDLVAVDDQVYFTADDGEHGRELWRSDGTRSGTVMVRDIYPRRLSSYPAPLTNVAGTVFFSAEDGVHGEALWKSDGTRRGTRMVEDVNPTDPPRDGPSVTSYFEAAAGTLFFSADDGVHGFELWKSDGTARGTELVRDIEPGDGDSWPKRMSAVGDRLFFAADDSHGRELWTSDGTTGGTVLVKDIAPVEFGTDYGPYPLGRLKGRLLFRARDDNVGNGVWTSDGTAAGTQLLAKVTANLPGAVVGKGSHAELYFLGDYDGLWKTDGTPDGTGPVTDLPSYNACELPGFCEITGELTAVGSSLYFAVNNYAIGTELWVSDGTPRGTGPVEDLYRGYYGNSGAYPSDLTVSGGTLFFIARDDRHGPEVFRVGGPAPRTPRCNGLKPTIVGFNHLVGTPGDDVIVGSPGVDTIDGLGGDDVICGGGGWDFIDGGAGNDLEQGGGGNDTFRQGSTANGADDIRGGGGADTLDYASRDTPLSVSIDSIALSDDGAVGERDDVRAVEVVEGGSAADMLIGGAADDTLDGGAGDDTMVGGDGDDLEYGHDGDDLFLGGATADGADLFDGQKGMDVVDYSDRRSPLEVDMVTAAVGDDGAAGEGDNLRPTVESVRGGRGGDTIRGNRFANTIFGGPGNDDLVGGLGDDTLDGGAGDDALDTRDGYNGNDHAAGGPGVDTAVFDESDVITEVP